MPFAEIRSRYTGRFAPSPTGPLHAGSLVAALASWLDARAHGGHWLVRIEDVDTPRCVAGADRLILGQLAALGLEADAPVLWQSTRSAAYAQALQSLVEAQLAYPCACSRTQIAADHARLGRHPPPHGELAYPGTCRPERGGLQGRPPRAWRFRVDEGRGAGRGTARSTPGRVEVGVEGGRPEGRTASAGITEVVAWRDRRLGEQSQGVEQAIGDVVLQRADGLWAYQLAVVVDDAHQGVTDVVRGEDLLDNTARQLLLQRALHLPAPRYLHLPLVRADDGEKLSKRHQAGALALGDPPQRLATLGAAARALGLPVALHHPASHTSLSDWLATAVAAWAHSHNVPARK